MGKSIYVVASLVAAMLLLGGNSWAEDKPQNAAASEGFEMDAWTSAKEINTIEAYEIYLSEHANGRHAKFARAAINKIKKSEDSGEIEASEPSLAKENGGAAAKPSAVATPQAAPAAAVSPASGVAETKPVQHAQETPAVSGSGNGDKAPKQ